MVLSGGGFRIGIHLGMHAAAVARGRAPDLLLATCGGAVAAATIASLPDDDQRKAWLASREMYQFWCGLRSSKRAGIARTLLQAARRHFARGSAATIPDLFQEYLFEFPPALPEPTRAGLAQVAVAIIGGKLLFDEAEVGQRRRQRKLFAETVFCDARAAALLAGMKSPLGEARWGNHAIADTLLTDTATPLWTAARISVSDMVYFRCHQHGAAHYIGGVLDLFPIELARRLAEQVVLEYKQSYDQLFAIPALRSVLGLDGNRRLKYVNGQAADVRIDTSDLETALPRESIGNRVNWRRNRIELAVPPDYATYVRHIEAQWQYGYQRAIEAFDAESRGAQVTMREATRHNAAPASFSAR